MTAGLLHGGRTRVRTRLLAAAVAAPLAAVGLVVAAPPASAAPLAGASASPPSVARHGTSTVTLTLDGESRTQSTPTDLVLVLDESGSIDGGEFNQLRAFADDVVEAVALDGLFTHGGRVGVVGFSGAAHTVINLDTSESAVRSAIAGNPQAGGTTCISCGLNQASALLGGSQPGRNQLVIVLTDGNANPGDPTGAAATALQSYATVYAVGIGNGVSQATLETIASGSGPANTFAASSFSTLAGLLQDIVEAVNVPGATNPRYTVTLAPGWDLVAGSVTASTGSVSGESVDGFTWSRADLGDQLVTVTYDVRHEGAPCGALPVNSGVAYNDDEGAAVAFPAVTVTANCLAPTADAGTDRTVAEGSTVGLDGTGSSDADGVLTSYAWSGADAAIGSFAGSTSAPTATYAGLDDGTDEITLEVADDNGLTDTDTTQVTVANVAPSLALSSCPVDPNAVGTAVSFAGAFTDPGAADTHTLAVAWGDGATTTVPTGTSVGASHVYTAAGVYDITVTVTDDDAGSDTRTCGFVVVFDPDGGFVTGGGHITSPAGAYAADPAATGRANFGFVSKYKRGATTPTGSTEFQFKAGNLNFHSSDYQWLVVSGDRAQYKGTGTINGVEGYGFLLTATDGAPDRLRMKISRLSDGAVVYDNQMGSSDTAAPSTALGGGSIVIHRG